MPAVGNIDELVATIGYSGFEFLVTVRGGRRLYVPTKLESAPQLIQWFGEDKAQKLVEAFGGFSVDIPNRRATTPPSRRQIIEVLIQNGKSDTEISELTQCTERAVRGYRSDMREALPGLKQAASR
jgi:hypothetical protein